MIAILRPRQDSEAKPEPQAASRASDRLANVEASQRIPPLKWGVAENLAVDDRGNLSCDYFSQTDHGLYSNVSTTMADVITLVRHGIAVTRVDLSRGFAGFKDEPGKDVYATFFAGIGDGLAHVCKGVEFDSWDVHELYRDLPLGALNAVAARLFPPSAGVRACADAMLADSGIVPERCLAIIYRGTDKGTEVTLAPIAAYIETARTILERHPDLDVVVQTDQAQARDAVVAAFGAKSRFFAALPVTYGSTVIHRLEFGVDVPMRREVFAQRMMAATWILSGCAYIVTHTGNVGLWTAIYRGSADDLYQFDRNGVLVPPLPR